MTKVKPPIWFWIVSVIALLWNAMGVMAYITDAFMTDESISQLTERQQIFYSYDFPAWYTACYAIAVFCGFLGCVFLLIRKSWATPLFIISLLAVVGQILHNFVLNDVYKELNLRISDSNFELSMQILIPVVAILLILFSRDSKSRNWIG